MAKIRGRDRSQRFEKVNAKVSAFSNVCEWKVRSLEYGRSYGQKTARDEIIEIETRHEVTCFRVDQSKNEAGCLLCLLYSDPTLTTYEKQPLTTSD